MRILALDLATKTGWASSDGGSGVQDFTLKRGESAGMKWIRFGTWMRNIVSLCNPDIIVYEQAHHRGGAATHSAHSLISQVEVVATEEGIEVTNYHTASIKKHATGKGRVGKDEMLDAAKERWPDVEIIDHNHADALWLLDLARSELVTQE